MTERNLTIRLGDLYLTEAPDLRKLRSEAERRKPRLTADPAQACLFQMDAAKQVVARLRHHGYHPVVERRGK